MRRRGGVSPTVHEMASCRPPSRAAMISRSMSSTRPSKLAFFKTFLAHPMQVGAVLPSGEQLCRHITDPIDFSTAKNLVELGPGTGAFTRVLLERMRPGTRLLAVELNDQMADWIAENLPQVELVRGDAGHLADHLRERKIETLDAVVSGLPFANFPGEAQYKILGAVHGALRKPGGLFLTFTYYHSRILPTTHRFEARLRKLFARVDHIPAIRNVPPAFVLRSET
jgi:phosphatidylethanolamine/phosphatidyl-N-methylethanolamine N-methyltransferase